MKVDYSEHKLKNGLRLLLVPSKSVNSVTITARLKAGSAYENTDNNGITHFLEHLSMTATKKWPDKFKLNEMLEFNGAMSNASTSSELLKYYTNLPSKNVELGLEYIEQVLFDCTFDNRYIESERQVILDEFSKDNDNVFNRAQLYSLEQLLPKNDPYSFKVIGELENIRNFSRKDFVYHYNKIHSPSNMHISIVGNFQEEHILKLIERNFSKLKNYYKPPKIKLNSIPKGKISTKFDMKSDLIIGDLHFGLPNRSNLTEKERNLLSKINLLLTGPMSSRLKKRLRDEEGLLYHIYGGFYINESFGFYNIGYECPPKIYERVLESIFDELTKLYKEGITDSELERFKEYSKNRAMVHFDNIYAYSKGILEPYSYRDEKIHKLEELLKIFDAATKSDINDLVHRYLNPAEANIFTYGKTNKNTKEITKKVRAKFIKGIK